MISLLPPPPPFDTHPGDLNKALKDLVTVITDQEIEQSDLNENEIEWANIGREAFSFSISWWTIRIR